MRQSGLIDIDGKTYRVIDGNTDRPAVYLCIAAFHGPTRSRRAHDRRIRNSGSALFRKVLAEFRQRTKADTAGNTKIDTLDNT